MEEASGEVSLTGEIGPDPLVGRLPCGAEFGGKGDCEEEKETLRGDRGCSLVG